MIRKARETDLKDIVSLLYQVHKVHSDKRPDYFKAGKRKYNDSEIISIIHNDEKPIFVYENENGKVLGYAFCIYQITAGSDSLTDKKTLYIDDLCVDENARGKKIGTMLFDYVAKFAKDNDFDNITLNVWSLNDAAQKFYESMGMVPLKTVMEMNF